MQRRYPYPLWMECLSVPVSHHGPTTPINTYNIILRHYLNNNLWYYLRIKHIESVVLILHSNVKHLWIVFKANTVISNSTQHQSKWGCFTTSEIYSAHILTDALSTNYYLSLISAYLVEMENDANNQCTIWLHLFPCSFHPWSSKSYLQYAQATAWSPSYQENGMALVLFDSLQW